MSLLASFDWSAIWDNRGLLAEGLWRTIQVSVITKAPGLSPLDVEQTVTAPLEFELNGIPGGREFRSVSRSGLSMVTVRKPASAKS